MSSFSDSALTEKLGALTNSQQSIQTMSLWLIHHRKHARKIVKIWNIELKRAKVRRKLVFIYLANDVVQNGKKKGGEFTKEFSTVIEHAFSHVLETAEGEKTKKALARVLSIWAERNVFSSQLLFKMTTILSGETPPPSKKARQGDSHHHHHHHHRQHRHSSKPGRASPAGTTAAPTAAAAAAATTPAAAGGAAASAPVSTDSDSQSEDTTAAAATAVKKDAFEASFGAKFEDLQGLLSGRGEEEDGEAEEEHLDPEDIPEADEIVQALQDMDNSASSDAVIREKIAKLPPEVQDASLLEKVQERDEADRLSSLVNDACSLLDDYNVRLSLELEDRQHVMRMLKNYRISQHQKLKEAEEKLKDFQSKHDKVTLVRKELESHIHNLPDLTLLPDVKGGLAPLPSAGDLFSV